jgi:hypothetical protein
MDPLTKPVGMAASAVGGRTLAVATRALAAIRSTAKPLHPYGSVLTATLQRFGVRPATGVGWLDEAGTDHVLVRWSRALGLPSPLVDIHGLAVRVPLPDGSNGDLLLATTGLGRLGRFVLTPSRSPYERAFTTLLPYRTPRGPLLLGAVGEGQGVFDLVCASPAGSWRRFGRLEMASAASDPQISFDPVHNIIPGLDNYDVVRRLREPSYGTARGTRGG